MFVLSDKTEFDWPVQYRVPKDGGKYDKVEFMARFRRLSQSRLDELMQRARDGQLDDGGFADEVLLGWSGIKTNNNEEFEFSETNKRILLDSYPGMRSAIVIAFHESVEGILRKN